MIASHSVLLCSGRFPIALSVTTIRKCYLANASVTISILVPLTSSSVYFFKYITGILLGIRFC